jgi:hypothetical protein
MSRSDAVLVEGVSDRGIEHLVRDDPEDRRGDRRLLSKHRGGQDRHAEADECVPDPPGGTPAELLFSPVHGGITLSVRLLHDARVSGSCVSSLTLSSL